MDPLYALTKIVITVSASQMNKVCVDKMLFFSFILIDKIGLKKRLSVRILICIDCCDKSFYASCICNNSSLFIIKPNLIKCHPIHFLRHHNFDLYQSGEDKEFVT